MRWACRNRDFERLLLPLGLLAAERAGEDLTDRAQQRDVVVCPALLGRDRIEAEEADALPAYHIGTQSQERMPRSVSLDFSSPAGSA